MNNYNYELKQATHTVRRLQKELDNYQYLLLKNLHSRESQEIYTYILNIKKQLDYIYNSIDQLKRSK